MCHLCLCLQVSRESICLSISHHCLKTIPSFYLVIHLSTMFLKVALSKSISYYKKSADIWEMCLTTLDCSVNVKLSIALLWFIIYCWLVSPLSLFLFLIYTQISDESPSSHHHSGTKNLFHTHTCTNTHLHSAAVCAQLQWLSGKEDENIQHQQLRHLTTTYHTAL